MGALLLLAKENYISYSKPIAKALGVDEAIIFGELCSINNMLNGIEWFYFEQPKIINDTCLSKHRVIKALKNLKDFGLVSYEKRGIPAKNYYKLHEEKLLELMKDYKDELQGKKTETTSSPKIEPQEVDTPSGLKIEPLEVQNLNHSKSKNETTINNKNTSKNNINKNTNNINIIDENFERVWKMLRSTPHDRKAQVKPKRKKELFEMGIERVEKAINLYLKTQDPRFTYKRDRFLNEIIDNYLDKNESDFYGSDTSYDIDQYEKGTKYIDPYCQNF